MTNDNWEEEHMQIQITGMENNIVTCEILNGDGGRIDIARRWFTEDAAVGDSDGNRS